MFFNLRSLFATALFSVCALEAYALDFKPITDPSEIIPPGQAGHAFKRNAGPAPVDLLPIDHPTVLTHGRSLRRAVTGKEAFDPSSESTFFWGAYAGDNIYVANFTLSNPGDDEFILPVEKFAKELKSIKCGTPGAPMVLEFKDQDSFDYASSAWDWVNKEDINSFTLVTEPDQCYKGDNRSPYLVSTIGFDRTKLVANIKAEEKDWADIAHTFDLHLRHQPVPRATANITHPHLFRRENSDMDISHTFNGELFNFAIDSLTTMGMAMSADAEIATSGHIIADFDIKRVAFVIPEDIQIKIQPQDVNALFKLTLNADGTLGKAIDWSMTPEIDIPIAALNIAKILQIGPFVTVGVHFGSSALAGTGDITTGAKGSLSNDAEVSVQLRKPDQNSFANWGPTIEKIDPVISAEFTGDLRAWAELAIVIKAEAFGRWGYQAGVEAQLPYFQADLVGTKDPAGVCGTQKTVGVDVDTSVGIDLSLQAGRVNAAPDFRKDLYTTSWALYTTCMAVGDDNAVTATATDTEAIETGEATLTGTGTEVIETGEPTGTEVFQDPTATETGTEVIETGEPTGTELLEDPTATDILDTAVETDFATATTGSGESEPTQEPTLTDSETFETDAPTQTSDETEILETEFPTLTDGADMPGQTIYKTIFITEGSEEVAISTEAELVTSNGELEPTFTEELPTETDVLTTTGTSEAEATSTSNPPMETEISTTAIDSELPSETTMAIATELPPKNTTAIDSELPIETGISTTAIDSELPMETEISTTAIDSELPSETTTAIATELPPKNTTAIDSELPIETGISTTAIDSELPMETDISTTAIDSEIPLETASTMDSELPIETGISTTAANSTLPTQTLVTGLPEETLPSESATAVESEILPTETLATNAVPTAEGPTVPIETDIPSTTLVGITGSSTGFPQINSTLVTLVGTAPPALRSTFMTMVSSAMASDSPLLPSSTSASPAGPVRPTPPPPPPHPPRPSVPAPPAKPEKPERSEVPFSSVAAPSVAGTTPPPGNSYRLRA